MPESTRSEHVTPTKYDNLLLKQWLRDKGEAGRREELTKLKADLQNLGLSRRQVCRGLLQLATKPRVILWRHTAYRRPKKSEKHEKPIDVGKTDSAFPDQHPRPQDEDTQTPDSTQGVTEEDTKSDEKIRTETEIPTSGSVSSKGCELEHQTPRSLDKRLEKINRMFSEIINIVNMNSERSSVIIPAADAFKLQNKNDAINNNTDKKSTCVKEGKQFSVTNEKTRTEEISDLTCDMVGQDIVYRPVRSEKNHIKLNLKSVSNKKGIGHAKSDVHKELDTVKSTSVRVDSASNQAKHAGERDDTSTDGKATKIDHLNKRKLYETTTVSSVEPKRKKIRAFADERKELDRKVAKTIKYKFRSFFGDCGSISEDEQEEHILQKRFKRTRKKDSVDSCDSGVYLSETNAVNSNGIEILRDIQKAVPDSTMHEDISEDSSSCRTEEDAMKNVTSDENVKQINDVENVTKNTDKQSQNDKCNVVNGVGNDEIYKKLNSIFYESNLVQSTTVLNSIETSSEDKKSDTDVSVLQDTDVDNNVSHYSTPKMCNINRDIDVTADLPRSATCGSDLRDLNKLLNMDFNETCQVTSNGNVLSIKEKTATNDNQDAFDKDTDEDLQLIFENCNQSIDQRASNVMNGSSSKDTSCLDAKKDVKTIPVRINLCNLLGNANEITLPTVRLDDIIEQKDKVSLPNSESNNMAEKEANVESECNVVAEKENGAVMSDSKGENQNTQPRKVPKIKLRVLSSAELGSRWCPTPVNAVISTTSELSSTNTVVTSDTGLTYIINNQVSSSSITTQAVLMEIPVISTTANVLNFGDTTSSNNLKKSNMDPKFSEAIYNSLVSIYHLIVSIRTSRVDYNNTLLKEFENLRKILNSEDHINLISAVVDILNKELFVNQPLTLNELLHYVPSFKPLYRRKSQEENNPNAYQHVFPAVVSNKTTKQNMHNNSQGLQSTTSVQNVLQNVFSSCTVQTPVSTNLKEKTSVQSQNNLMQNNVPMNSTAASYGIQQSNFRIPLQTYYRHQRPPTNAYFIRQHPTPVQRMPLLINPNETGIRYNQPVTNTPFLYNYLLGGNTYGNVNTPNYIAQQTMTQTHRPNIRNVPCMGQSKFQNSVHRQTAYMPQEIQPQLPQNIPVINHTTQAVQNNSVSNAPKSKKHVPKYTQRNEARQNMPVQIQTQVPQSVTSKQLPIPLLQHTQSQNKQKNIAQISLESTVKQFGILKYLSDIQKIMLLQQLNFYFGCTMWLQQQFTTKQWQIINSQRSTLLHFQTLLKHFVQNNIYSISPNISQSNNNILINTENNIQKEVQITVQRNEETHCPVSTSNIEEEQCKTASTDGCNVPYQKNLITLTSKNQSENEQQVIGNLTDKQLLTQSRESETLQNEEIQRNKQTEQTLVQKNQSIVMSDLETPKILDSNIKRKSEGSTDSVSEQNLNSCVELIYDVPYAVQKEVPIISNLEQFCKDTLQQSNPDLTDEQDLNNSIKIINNVPYISNKKVPITSNLNVFHKDTIQQSNPHLVTVQISSHNYEVRVIDTNAVDETEDKEVELIPTKPKEYEQLDEDKHNVSVSSCVENNTCENFLEVHSPNASDDTKHFSNKDINNSLLEEPTISYIADVRSITLEAFEGMEETDNTPVNNSEENIIEEEVKVCLCCGKPSSVLCSVCLEANYCSNECLRLHWEEHYQDCKPVKNSVYL